jgi:hypothetical protein
VGITHFEDAREIAFELGHLRGRWTRLARVEPLDYWDGED